MKAFILGGICRFFGALFGTALVLMIVWLVCWAAMGCTAKAKAGDNARIEQIQGVGVDVEKPAVDLEAQVRAAVKAALQDNSKSAGGNIQTFDLWSVLSGAVPWAAFTLMWGAERWWGKYRPMGKEGAPKVCPPRRK